MGPAGFETLPQYSKTIAQRLLQKVEKKSKVVCMHNKFPLSSLSIAEDEKGGNRRL
jgi:hypothetical protein